MGFNFQLPDILVNQFMIVQFPIDIDQKSIPTFIFIIRVISSDKTKTKQKKCVKYSHNTTVIHPFITSIINQQTT